nr:SET and MYND domain-containing protein 4-like [Penaeus vannamei]
MARVDEVPAVTLRLSARTGWMLPLALRCPEFALFSAPPSANIEAEKKVKLSLLMISKVSLHRYDHSILMKVLVGNVQKGGRALMDVTTFKPIGELRFCEFQILILRKTKRFSFSINHVRITFREKKSFSPLGSKGKMEVELRGFMFLDDIPEILAHDAREFLLKVKHLLAARNDSAMEKTLNLKAMITKFLKEIKHKLGETMTHFDPEDDEEYMFAYLWGMHEAHRFLTPHVPAAAKSQESAEVCRSEGNRYYNMGNFETARSLYSKGIMLAPHPTLNDNSSCRGRSTPGEFSLQDTESIDNRSTYEDYDTLAICYANRSAVHMELGYFDDCLRDIDLAFQAGYPDETKLMKRKVRCLHARGKDDKPSKMEMLAVRHLHGRPREETFHERFRLYQQSQTGGHIFTDTFRKSLLSESEVPTSKVSDPHPNIPALSSAVTLAYKPDRGRHIVTARDVYPGSLDMAMPRLKIIDILAGETLLVEDSFCTCLKEASLARRCTTCCNRSINPLPCPTCCLVVFCSEECRERGLADFHEQECEVLPALAAFSGDTPCVLAFRILMKLSFARLKELIPRLKKEAETLPPEKLGFDEDGVYSSSDFRAIYHLCSNKQHHTNKQLFGRCIEAFIVTKLLEMSRRYFVNSRGEAVCPSEEDVLLTGSTLVSLIMKLRCNIFTDFTGKGDE